MCVGERTPSKPGFGWVGETSSSLPCATAVAQIIPARPFRGMACFFLPPRKNLTPSEESHSQRKNPSEGIL